MINKLVYFYFIFFNVAKLGFFFYLVYFYFRSPYCERWIYSNYRNKTFDRRSVVVLAGISQCFSKFSSYTAFTRIIWGKGYNFKTYYRHTSEIL